MQSCTNMKHTNVMFLVLCSLCRTVAFLIPSLVVIGGSLVSKPLYCYLKECCNDRWIPQNFTSLKAELKQKVFGQHIAIEIVHKAIKGHIQNPNPAKALVLSFHGRTGCGKNHVSKIIADNLYKLGMKSKYTHQIIVTHDFPHQDRVAKYKDDLQNFIIEKVKECPRSLFIFDELDKIPAGLIDILKPYLDYHQEVGGVDYRKCIFIFLSNTGANIISSFVVNHWRQGNKREDLTFKDMEQIINNGAFNSKGGLWHSQLISRNLIDFFVPFMPLEKSHVKKCIEADLRQKNKTVENHIVNKVADQMQYSNPDNVFSSTGCKKVSSRVDFVIEE